MREFCVTSCFNCCQADTRIQGLGSRFQTSSEDDTIHRSEQHAAEQHGSGLRVRQHRQLKPNLREQLPASQGWAEQRGGKPHRAVQHHQRIHCGHHTRCPLIGKHIATKDCGLVSQQARTEGLSSSVTTYFVLTESCRDVGVVTMSTNWATH